MCGIAGILTAHGNAAGMSPAVNAMRLALRHRGPDDEGVWCDDNGLAAFAHTRLAILDLSPAGHQPMSLEDGRFTITFNGEIFNFRELRRSLEQRGVRFQTHTDTEVILRAYEADGPACVAQLRGMFAFALWDARERVGLIARDRFGIKPLYYHAEGGQLVFASELRALVASTLVRRDLDPDAVYGYLRSGSVPEPRTMLRDVRCFQPGHLGIWKAGTLTTERYWQLEFSPAAESPGQSVAMTRGALVDSVTHHLVSDTPVGVFLSGGIDSTALVALTRQATAGDISTFSITFPGCAGDEGALARRTSKLFGTTHAEWAIDGTIAQGLFRRFLRTADQPSIDGLNIFAASQLAREQGVKVVLSGLGGDELFGGYPSFAGVPRLADWNRRLSFADPIRPMVGRGIERLATTNRWRRIGEALSHEPTLANAYATFRGIFTRAEARALAAGYGGSAAAQAEVPDEPATDRDPGDAVSRLELTRYMRNQLLRDADTTSMAWGVEVRVPFLDQRVVQTLAGIPAATRLQRPKQLLLDAIPEIPAWVREQPKRGFMFPFEAWLRESWRDQFAEIEASSPIRLETWYRKMCILSLESWLSNMSEAGHA